MFSQFSQSRLRVALARQSRCLEPWWDFSLSSQWIGYEPSAESNRELNQRDAGRFWRTAMNAANWFKFLKLG
jgi:hypothetical protein